MNSLDGAHSGRKSRLEQRKDTERGSSTLKCRVVYYSVERGSVKVPPHLPDNLFRNTARCMVDEWYTHATRQHKGQYLGQRFMLKVKDVLETRGVAAT